MDVPARPADVDPPVRWGLVLRDEVMAPGFATVSGAPSHDAPELGPMKTTSPRRSARSDAARLSSRRRHLRLRCRSDSASTLAVGTAPAHAESTLEDWERRAVSLYRSVKSCRLERGAQCESGRPEPPGHLPRGLMLFSVLRACADVSQSVQPPTAAAVWRDRTPFLLSLFLQTSVLTASTTTACAQQCADWLVAHHVRHSMATGSPVSVHGTSSIGPLLATVVRALHTAGRLRCTKLIGEWLIAVFLRLLASPVVVGHSPDVTRAAWSAEWWAAGSVRDCLFLMRDDGTGSLETAASTTQGTEYLPLATELYVHVLERTVNAFGHDACVDAQPSPNAVTALLKLGFLVRMHPMFRPPESIDSCAGQPTTEGASVELSPAAVESLTVTNEAWRHLQRQSLHHAQRIRSGSVVSVIMLGYLLDT